MKVKQPNKPTAVVPAKREPTTLPALPLEWQEELAVAAKDETTKEAPQVTAFSLRAGVLSYNDQPMPDNKVRGIIVASAFENAMFINKFDPSNITPPLCFALSITGEDMMPHDGSYKKQGSKEGMCEGCPQSEWGSDPNSPSGRGKMCKETRRLAIIPESALEEGIDKATVAMLRVPVTSVANWSDYVHLLNATAKRPPWSVITEISVTPNPKTQFSVNFQPVDAINDVELLNKVKALNERANKSIMTPYATMTEEQYKDCTEEKPKKKAKF